MKNVLDNYKGVYLINANFYEVYSNLYSFSSKLKGFAPTSLYNKYLEISRKLIEKSDLSQEQFSDLVNQVLHMDRDFRLLSYIDQL